MKPEIIEQRIWTEILSFRHRKCDGLCVCVYLYIKEQRDIERSMLNAYSIHAIAVGRTTAARTVNKFVNILHARIIMICHYLRVSAIKRTKRTTAKADWWWRVCMCVCHCVMCQIHIVVAASTLTSVWQTVNLFFEKYISCIPTCLRWAASSRRLQLAYYAAYIAFVAATESRKLFFRFHCWIRSWRCRSPHRTQIWHTHKFSDRPFMPVQIENIILHTSSHWIQVAYL